MSDRKGKEKRSSSPEKSKSEKERKPKQSSTKRQNTKKNDRSDHMDTKRLDDDRLETNSTRTYSLDDTWHPGGNEEPPFNGFFNFSANTGSRETYAQNASKETNEDPFAYIREKLKSEKLKNKDQIPSKNPGREKDSSGSDCDSYGESESFTDSGSSQIATKKMVAELPRKFTKLSMTHEEYEWQFFDERWITYGQANFAGTQPSKTEYQSEDIEAFYRSRYPEQRYMLVQNEFHTYKLDLKEMTQTNQSTSVKRRIRRHPKQAVNTSPSHELSDYSGPGTSNMHHGFGSGDCGDNPHSRGTGHTRLVWQFKDESGTWITYGLSSPAGGHGSGTTTSSDDIEKFRLKNPDVMMMAIKSSHHQYVLDFQKMTQTNIKTSVERKLRSVPFTASNANSPTGASGQAIGGHNSGGAFGEVFVWQFQDDNEAWVTYGRSSSSQKTPSASTVTSDDIEQFYNVKRGMEPMKISISLCQYLLDFQKLTQTNLTSGNRRRIRRIANHLLPFN